MSQVKFKIGFTIPSETLIAMIAKFLPIEDLSVEEIVPRVASTPKPLHLPTTKKYKRASPGPNLEKGINGLILTELSTGPKRAVEMQPKIAAAGYSASSVPSRMEELRRFGVIEPVGNGLWKRCET